MKKSFQVWDIVKEILILTAAIAIITSAVFFFLVPSHTSISSISGLGIILTNFIPLPLSAITMILNVLLLAVGFLTCGREFGAKTVYTTILLPLMLALLEKLFPHFTSLTGSQELDALCYVLVVSVGLCILFNRNASSGGLDIVAMVMNKYLHIEIGKALSAAGMCIALSAGLVYDSKSVGGDTVWVRPPPPAFLIPKPFNGLGIFCVADKISACLPFCLPLLPQMADKTDSISAGLVGSLKQFFAWEISFFREVRQG